MTSTIIYHIIAIILIYLVAYLHGKLVATMGQDTFWRDMYQTYRKQEDEPK